MSEQQRTEFPYLDARISYLEHTLYNVQQQVNAQAFDNKLDSAAQKWLQDTRDELAEMQYVKRKVLPQDRIGVGGTQLALYLILVGVTILLVWKWFGM